MARFINQNSLGAGWQFDFLDNEGVNTDPGFLGVLYHNNTAKRTYTFPDKDGTIATMADTLANPMTTLGDLIVGGASGSPSRLAKGTDGQFLVMVSGSPAWAGSIPTLTIDGLTGNANADVTLTGRNAGSANPGHVGANWNGGIYVTPNAGDTTFRLQHPSSTPTIGHWVAYTADLYDATGRTTFGRVQLITTNVSGAGASTGDWVFSLIDAGTLSERLRLKSTGEVVYSGRASLAASTATRASMNIPAGSAPSSPANGDMWNVGGELFWGNGSQAQQLTDVITSTVGNGTLNLDGRLKSVVKIDLQGATTINMVNGGRDGQRLTLELKQDATGGHGITMGTGVAWGGDVTEYVPTTLPNKTDYVGLIYNATAATWRVIAIAKGY